MIFTPELTLIFYSGESFGNIQSLNSAEAPEVVKKGECLLYDESPFLRLRHI